MNLYFKTEHPLRLEPKGVLSLSDRMGISKRAASHLRQEKNAGAFSLFLAPPLPCRKAEKVAGFGRKNCPAFASLYQRKGPRRRAGKPRRNWAVSVPALRISRSRQNRGFPLPEPAASPSVPVRRRCRRPHTGASGRCPSRHTGRSAGPDGRRFSAAAAAAPAPSAPAEGRPCPSPGTDWPPA